MLQNADVIPTKQHVYVKGGYVDVDNTFRVKGSVDVTGSVEVDNMVDVNLNVLNRPVVSHSLTLLKVENTKRLMFFNQINGEKFK